jgi:hypothetical protein
LCYLKAREHGVRPNHISVIEEDDGGPVIFITSDDYHQGDTPPFMEFAGYNVEFEPSSELPYWSFLSFRSPNLPAPDEEQAREERQAVQKCFDRSRARGLRANTFFVTEEDGVSTLVASSVDFQLGQEPPFTECAGFRVRFEPLELPGPGQNPTGNPDPSDHS